MKKPDIALCGYAGAGKTSAAQYLVEHHGYTRHSFAGPLRQLFRAIFGRDVDKTTDRERMQKLGTDVARNEAWANVDKALDVDGKREKRRDQLNAAIQLQIEMVGTRPNDCITADLWWDRVIAAEKLLYASEGFPFARGFGSHDFWAQKAADVMRNRTVDDGPVVFDDLRFPNEAERVRERGAVIVHVDADIATVERRIRERDGHCDPAMFEHESERWHQMIPCDAMMPGLGETSFNVERLMRDLTNASNAA